ncbi:MAG: DNA primase [Opitutae bacterium]|nr:DNA primase [Opitutae bacterium]
MPSIKPTCIRDLKMRINLADVVSRVVTLRKAGGARLKGLCPFHNEKTPSFHVDPDKGFYKCFGCGKAGDIISFVRETEQLNFAEAIEALGQRFGVPIEYEVGAGPSREERSLRQEIFELHELAADHFHQALRGKSPVGEFMRTYWTDKRRFAMEIAEEFKIGAAAPTDDGLAAMLLKRRFSEDALRQCGLFFVRESGLFGLGSLRPRFRGRLMIPIRDHQGRVVAFTARQTDLTPEDDPAREAKYVNSPETPIFTKGNLLFNLDRARTAVGDDRPFVVVEGQLDAIRCWSVGLKTAIAPQGTSITESQLVLLRRYSHQVECFFDSDTAGQKAALRLLPMALRAGLEVRFLRSAGDGKVDPDVLFLERGLDAYTHLRTEALSIVEFLRRYILPEPQSATPEQLSRALKQVYEVISAAESEVMRRRLIGELSTSVRAFRITPDVFERDFLKHTPTGPAPASPPSAPVVPTGPSATPEHHLLLVLLHNEALGKPLSHALPHDWIDTSHPAGVLLHRFLGEIEHDNWPGRDHLDPLLETGEERTLVASLLFDTPVIDDPHKVVGEGLRQLRSRALEPRLRKIELDLASHGADSDVDAISLIKERSDLQRQLRQPIGLPGVGL